MPGKCIIVGLNRKESGSSFRIYTEAKKIFGDAALYLLPDLKVIAGRKTEVLGNGEDLTKAECVYLRGSYRYVKLLSAATAILQKNAYLPLKSESFEIAHDKFVTLIKLSEAGIPVPQTYLAYTIRAAKKLLDEMNYPVVIKLPAGTHGKGVMFADSKESAKSIIDTLDIVTRQPLVIQEYVEAGAKDIRAFVIGDKVFAMERTAGEEELRANMHMGGTGREILLDYDVKHMARKAAKIIGAEIAGIDILKSSSGCKVCEINVSPSVNGISKATRKNIAEEIAKFLYEKSVARKEVKKEHGFREAMDEIESEKVIETQLDVKGEKIRLPGIVSKVGKLIPGDDVVIKVKKGKVEIEKI